jgi:hypothetical protein
LQERLRYCSFKKSVMRPIALHDKYPAHNTGKYFSWRILLSYRWNYLKIILSKLGHFYTKSNGKTAFKKLLTSNFDCEQMFVLTANDCFPSLHDPILTNKNSAAFVLAGKLAPSASLIILQQEFKLLKGLNMSNNL